MSTKPFSLQSPEQIAKDYGGNKQKIASAAQMGLVDSTAAVLAGMFIDRMRSAQMQEQQPQQTVAQQVLSPQPQGGPPPGPPQGGAPMGMAPPPQGGAPMGMAGAPPIGGMQHRLGMATQQGGMPVPPPQGAGPGFAEGGLASLPVPGGMFDEPANGGFNDGGLAPNYAGGGIVAFADGGETEDSGEGGSDTPWYNIPLNRFGEVIEAYDGAQARRRKEMGGRVVNPDRPVPQATPAPSARGQEQGQERLARLLRGVAEGPPVLNPDRPVPQATPAPMPPRMAPPAGMPGRGTDAYVPGVDPSVTRAALRIPGTPPVAAPPARPLAAAPLSPRPMTAPAARAPMASPAPPPAPGAVPAFPGPAQPPPLSGAAAAMAELQALAPQDHAMRDTMAKRYADMSSPEALAAQKKQDLWSTLAQIGFGMAGSNSPYFLQAAGQAGAAALPGMQQATQARKAQELAGLQGQLGLENLTNQERQSLAARATELSEQRRKGEIDQQQFETQMELKRDELKAQREHWSRQDAAEGARVSRGSGGGGGGLTANQLRNQAKAAVDRAIGRRRIPEAEYLQRVLAAEAAIRGGGSAPVAPPTTADYTFVNGKLVPARP